MQPGHRELSEEDWQQVAHACHLSESQRDKVCCALPEHAAQSWLPFTRPSACQSCSPAWPGHGELGTAGPSWLWAVLLPAHNLDGGWIVITCHM